jgi:hypothetical protein
MMPRDHPKQRARFVARRPPEVVSNISQALDLLRQFISQFNDFYHDENFSEKY